MAAEKKMTIDRNKRKIFQGVVVSDKMQKTRIIKVERLVRHSFYEKIITKSSKFSAHDEENASHAGDLVEIISTRPLSKSKRWRIVRVVRAAPRVLAPETSAQKTTV